MHQKIIILDFGGQYAHLIASRIRRLGVLAEIMLAGEEDLETLRDPLVKGIVLSGGPQSVFEDGSPKCDPAIFELEKPLLGLCYGHQFMAHALGGSVSPGKVGEFGRAQMTHDGACPLFQNIPEDSIVWMNHVDEVGTPGTGFTTCGSTPQCRHAAVWNGEKNWFSLQCHVEVSHSEYGNQMLENFLDICGCSRDWTIEKFYAEHEASLKNEVGDRNVLLFVSGGVDSTVAFALLTKILGHDRVKGVFVDTGMLRQGEVDFVETSLRKLGADLTVLREADTFLAKLKDIADPEQKREIIGHAFLEVQQHYFADHELGTDWLLGQGTIYPDTIETGATKHADKIKTHHNRAPEVQKLIDEGKVIEPLAELYKDEVRALGELLGLPHDLVWRHPFPGPGLGVRILCSDEAIDEPLVNKIDPFTMTAKRKPFTMLPIKSVGVQGDFRTYKHPGVLRSDVAKRLGSKDEEGNVIEAEVLHELEKMATKLINHYSEINRCIYPLGSNFVGDIRHFTIPKCCVDVERVERLQRADHAVTELLQSSGHYSDIWQFPVVLLPIGLNKTGKECIVLRPVDSLDAMSASVGKLPLQLLHQMAGAILEDKEISAVFLDVTSKPPGTIEWE